MRRPPFLNVRCADLSEHHAVAISASAVAADSRRIPRHCTTRQGARSSPRPSPSPVTTAAVHWLPRCVDAHPLAPIRSLSHTRPMQRHSQVDVVTQCAQSSSWPPSLPAHLRLAHAGCGWPVLMRGRRGRLRAAPRPSGRWRSPCRRSLLRL